MRSRFATLCNIYDIQYRPFAILFTRKSSIFAPYDEQSDSTRRFTHDEVVAVFIFLSSLLATKITQKEGKTFKSGVMICYFGIFLVKIV